MDYDEHKYHNSGPEDPGDGKTWPCLLVAIVVLGAFIFSVLKITGSI